MSLFKSKYRILPVYYERKCTGYVVYRRTSITKVWIMVTIDTLVINLIKQRGSATVDEQHAVENNGTPAYFKTEQEAVDYIEHLKNLR